jgi:hypothetical protein
MVSKGLVYSSFPQISKLNNLGDQDAYSYIICLYTILSLHSEVCYQIHNEHFPEMNTTVSGSENLGFSALKIHTQFYE